MDDRLSVAFVVFDDMEVLDFAGPYEVFGVAGHNEGAQLFDVFSVAEQIRPIVARNNLKIIPDHSFASLPRTDVLVMPGGRGTRREMGNETFLDFVRAQQKSAQYVLSICSGALILGAAGLLNGQRVTTHHAAFDELRTVAPLAVMHKGARITDNGRLILSAGISAGIDMALYTVARIYGMDRALSTASYMEYDWHYCLPDGQNIIVKPS